MTSFKPDSSSPEELKSIQEMMQETVIVGTVRERGENFIHSVMDSLATGKANLKIGYGVAHATINDGQSKTVLVVAGVVDGKPFGLLVEEARAMASCIEEVATGCPFEEITKICLGIAQSLREAADKGESEIDLKDWRFH